jgi:Putative metallopeptidase
MFDRIIWFYECPSHVAGELKQNESLLRVRGHISARRSPLHVICAILTLLMGTGLTLAQQAPPVAPSFQARIEETARALQETPLLKGLSEQQRIDRVEFVVGNVLFWLLHEMVHVLVTEMHLPVLGREEDAADTYAVLAMLKIGTDFSHRVLADAAKGWFYDDRRDQQTGAKLLFYDEHNLSQQRAYQIVCLMVGSDPTKFKELANEVKMPETRRETCRRDFAKASAAWNAVLMPHRRAGDGPEVQTRDSKIKIVYGDGAGGLEAFAKLFRSVRLLETVAEHAEADYVWPASFTLEMQSCGHPGADWDDEARKVTVCYDLAFDFAELYRAYVPLRPMPTPAGQKRRSK